MTHYTNIKMRISVGKNDKNMKAIESNCKFITIRFGFTDLYGEDVIALTKSQVDRLVKAYEEKNGITIRMSKTQLAHNSKIDGGFLPALAGLIPFINGTILPDLGVGVLSGLASSGVQKLIGNELYLKKGGSVCQTESNGRELYLGPVSSKGLENVGMAIT